MLKYEFFNPAIKGLNPGDAARVTKCLEAAMLYGAMLRGESRGELGPVNGLRTRYNAIISNLNVTETFGKCVSCE